VLGTRRNGVWMREGVCLLACLREEIFPWCILAGTPLERNEHDPHERTNKFRNPVQNPTTQRHHHHHHHPSSNLPDFPPSHHQRNDVPPPHHNIIAPHSHPTLTEPVASRANRSAKTRVPNERKRSTDHPSSSSSSSPCDLFPRLQDWPTVTDALRGGRGGSGRMTDIIGARGLELHRWLEVRFV
jgi:hypothetical protein